MTRFCPILLASLVVCASLAASRATGLESAVALLTKKTTALLPSGWSASRTNHTIVVRRIASVRMVNMINAPGMMEGEKDDAYQLAHSIMDHYSISLRLGDPLSLKQLAEMRRHNAAVQKRLDGLEKKMAPISHKFDQYRPSTPQEKKLVAQYAATKAAYREVPEYHYQGFAAYLTVEPSDIYSFYSQRESQECDRVRAAVVSNLQPYESKTPNQAVQRTGASRSGSETNPIPGAAGSRR